MSRERESGDRRRRVFEFGDLKLDSQQCAVFRGTLRIPLPKLTYGLLLALVEGSPKLLTHEDLVEQVWRGRFVTPETVAQRAWLLRRALADDARNPRYVRGVRGLGYQLIPEVRVRNDLGRRPLRAAADRSSTLPDSDAELAADIDLSLPAQPSIVVLPFGTVGENAEHRNLALGLTHDIMTRIARARCFFVIARGSALRFGAGPHDVRSVGRKLGVRYVVQGHVEFSGSAVSVTASLSDSIEGKEIWSEDFRRKLAQVFDAREEISDLIVGSIASEVDLAEQQRALLETPANLDAWSAYHRGCWHMYRFTAKDYEQAQRFFELSLKLDRNSSRPLAGLSFVHWQRAFLEISPNRLDEARRALDFAQQSVSINPRDPLGHWALGRAYLLLSEMREAVAELSLATTLNPSFAVGQYSLGFALMHVGDMVRSIETADKARRLSPYDPMSFAMIGLRGFSLAMMGNYEEAAKLMAVSIRQPNAHFHMVAMAAVCDVLAGDAVAARRDLGRLLKARPGYGAREFLLAFQLQRSSHARLVDEAFQRLERLS